MADALIDVSQVKAFQSKLRAAPSAYRKKAEATTRRAAFNIKQSIRKDLASSSNQAIRSIPIEYDDRFLQAPGEIAIQIGPKAVEGGLANIAFFGTAKGGGTHQFYEHADEEASTWAKYLAEAAASV